MEQIVLDVLEGLTNKKRIAGQSPDFVLDNEFKAEITQIIKEVLRKLWKEKRIKLGRTINNNFIELLEKV
ncbi:hypothetical protein DWB61_03695 [Ancylomarina euxinus]|uniref:Uncharacterized protein n=1 Tax=Ancylomarina euxinus TaxID=2283627 RepID=A0A425Y6U6_9BACT|nr:hypothetical protein [Ancylomarina euxinus]MCZ4693896.1 hypothetical protein [Ancylomarina euxinus]MUP14684.1 hypothetical protein [Ancylomarina euxinus]RRG24229.1 hypothetical protein DWB61_03695 [Ancylomarina euxinus]